MHDDFRQQAYDYLYQRSIILAQDPQLIAYLADHLRKGGELPRNQRAFTEFAERYVRSILPIGQLDEKQIEQTVTYYARIGVPNRQRGPARIIAVVLAIGLLAAVIVGIGTTLVENADTEQISTAAAAGRTILIVGVVLALYYWVSLKVYAVLAFIRVTLLLVLIVALVWLLHDNGVIDLNL